MKRNVIRKIQIAGVMFVLLFSTKVKAQLLPLSSVYYQNQYLANPAMAGLDTGLNLNAGFRKEWSAIPGSPVNQVLSAEYGTGKKAGLGINIYNDKIGLQKLTRAVATYAYHLPLNSGGTRLNLGVSLGFSNERINTQDVNRNSGDVAIGHYNQRDTYIDGDFGASYTSEKLTIQGALPNLKSVFNKDYDKDAIDRLTFFAAASYKLEFGGGVGVEPKLVMRGIKGMDNIMDVGANVSFLENKLSFMGMYHSTKSTTFGFGIRHQNMTISGMYTNVTTELTGYSNGNFELNFGLRLFNK